MLAGIIGADPILTRQRVCIPPSLNISTRSINKLASLGICFDAIRIVNICYDKMNEKKLRAKEPKAPETWVHGGLLMTSDDIIARISSKEEAMEAKRNEKKEKAMRVAANRIAWEEKKAADALARAERKRQKSEKRKRVAHDNELHSIKKSRGFLEELTMHHIQKVVQL